MFPAETSKISAFLRIAALGSLVALSACARPARPIPAPKETPLVTTAEPRVDEPAPPVDEEVPTTPEEIRHRKAEIIVAEKELPAEMSRDDMIRLIDETEQRLPLEPDAPTETPVEAPKTEAPKTETANAPAPAPTGGLLSVEPKAEPKVELPKFTPPPLPPAMVDHTAVRKPILPVPVPKTEVKTEPKTEPEKTPTAWVWPTIPPKKTTPSPTPETKPEPKKEEPKVEPKTPVEKEPSVDPTAANDNGVDADDEKFEEEYAGPKTVIDHPASTAEYQLSEVAAQLGAMNKTKYLGLQKDTIGTKVKSCNFFFVVALIEAKGPDAKGDAATSKNYPGSMAAQLDTAYFQPAGWERISLEDLKRWFREGRAFDVAIQRDAPKGKKHGHVAIPIGLNADGNVMVAEASYLTVSNRIAVYSDSSLKSKFKIFARWTK